MRNRKCRKDIVVTRTTEEDAVPIGHLTRGQMLKLSGAAAAAGVVGGRVPDALATPLSDPSGPVEVAVVDVRGNTYACCDWGLNGYCGSCTRTHNRCICRGIARYGC